jgi:hypothetical protein
MTSPLEKLRAFARNTAPYDERNAKNETIPSPAPADGLNSFYSFLSLSESAADLDERAAIVEHDGGAPKTWAEGFAAMLAMPAPSGFSAQRWQRIVDATGTFLDRWTDTAIDCGWSNLDVFGCDRDRPDARFDAMGLVLLLDRCEVVSIDEAGADLVTTTGARQRYRRRPLPPGTVSLWELVRR